MQLKPIINNMMIDEVASVHEIKDDHETTCIGFLILPLSYLKTPNLFVRK